MEELGKQYIESAMKFLNRNPELKNFVKNFDDPKGFAWSTHPNIQKLSDGLIDDEHSATSFAYTMRKCQEIIRTTY